MNQEYSIYSITNYVHTLATAVTNIPIPLLVYEVELDADWIDSAMVDPVVEQSEGNTLFIIIF